MQSTETEIWKPVVGFEGVYEVSDQGRVRSLPRTVQHARFGTVVLAGQVLKPRPHHRGHHLYVTLSHAGRRRNVGVHRLVLEAFVGPAPNDTECCHNDGDPTNNRVPNLRWDSHAANMADRAIHDREGSSARAPKPPREPKRACKYGHLLRAPNLVVTKADRRRCLTCNRTRKWCAARGLAFDPRIAARYYSRITFE